MTTDSRHYRGVAAHLDCIAEHGVYGLLVPQNHGGRKGELPRALIGALARGEVAWHQRWWNALFIFTKPA